MFKALTDLIDNLFKPVNAFFSKLTGAALPAQGGNVLGRTPEKDNWGKQAGRLVDRLQQFVIDGAPTPLTALPFPTAQLTALFASSPIQLAADESRKQDVAGVLESMREA
jgi:hypothetical protein